MVSREEAGVAGTGRLFLLAYVLFIAIASLAGFIAQKGSVHSMWLGVAAIVLPCLLLLQRWRQIDKLQKNAREEVTSFDGASSRSMEERKSRAKTLYMAAGGIFSGGRSRRFDLELWRRELRRLEMEDVRTVVVGLKLSEHLSLIAPETEFVEAEPAGATGWPRAIVVALFTMPATAMGVMLLYSNFTTSLGASSIGNTMKLIGIGLTVGPPIGYLVWSAIGQAHVRRQHLIAPGRFAKRRFGFVREFSAAESVMVVYDSVFGLMTQFHFADGIEEMQFPRTSDRGFIRLWRLWNYEGTPAPPIYEAQSQEKAHK